MTQLLISSSGARNDSMDSQQSRRLAVLRGQLDVGNVVQEALENSVGVQHTFATANIDFVHPFSVALPENLNTCTGDTSFHVRRSVLSPQKLVTSFKAPDDHIRTLYDNLSHSIAAYPNGPFLGERAVDDKGRPGPYRWMSYAEAGEARSAIGSGLQHYGVPSGAAVGIYSINCRDWVLVDSALHAYSMISVPLYDTLGPEAVRYICSHAELAAVACSADVLPTLLKCLPDCPTVKLVVVYKVNPHQRLPDPPTGVDCKVVTLEVVRALGKNNPRPHVPPTDQSTATLCYTSGTTGLPKGAVLTHASLIANAGGSEPFFEILEPGDRHISYLPLAHIYERMNAVSLIHRGCAIGFYRGNVLELLDDIIELKPHIFCSVPRLWNRIYDKVMAQVNSSNAIRKKLFHLAYQSKLEALHSGDMTGGRMGAFWDKVVFSKIRARLGGEVKVLTTGSAPISEEVYDFMRICFGAVVYEGYGMTETSCIITLTRPDDVSAGHVGAPILSCEIKLADLPEMNYTNADKPYPRGEICVRGPIVFKGYHKADEQTREVMDADGWLHTGDVGMWLPSGCLKIVDRKKNIFKLAQGEYIAPEKIENVYVRCPMVLQAFVYGDSLKPQLVGVVVPDPEVLLPWAAERGLTQDVGVLCDDPTVVAMVLESMQQEGRTGGLHGFEQVQAIVLAPEQFTVENGLLTPTFKLKRPQAQAAFQNQITRMYAKLEANKKP